MVGRPWAAALLGSVSVLAAVLAAWKQDTSDPYLSTHPRASLGSPLQTFSVDRYTVYVYARDVLTSFASTCAGRADHQCNP
jgi:hypothetical protein